jgi:hypothetical protein
MAFQQMQQEAPVLKYPEDFGLHPNVSLENAANMLFRAIQTSQNQPYTWTFIDKPQGMNSAKDLYHELTYFSNVYKRSNISLVHAKSFSASERRNPMARPRM